MPEALVKKLELYVVKKVTIELMDDAVTWLTTRRDSESVIVCKLLEQYLDAHANSGILRYGKFIDKNELRMVRWRTLAFAIGRLMGMWRRAKVRLYAPGGVGYEECLVRFASMSEQLEYGQEDDRVKPVEPTPAIFSNYSRRASL